MAATRGKRQREKWENSEAGKNLLCDEHDQESFERFDDRTQVSVPFVRVLVGLRPISEPVEQPRGQLVQLPVLLRQKLESANANAQQTSIATDMCASQ